MLRERGARGERVVALLAQERLSIFNQLLKLDLGTLNPVMSKSPIKTHDLIIIIITIIRILPFGSSYQTHSHIGLNPITGQHVVVSDQVIIKNL